MSGWPNLANGFTVITDQPMTSKTPTIGNDWSGTFPIELDNSGGPEQGAPLFGYTKDPTDPFSPPGFGLGTRPWARPAAEVDPLGRRYTT